MQVDGGPAFSREVLKRVCGYAYGPALMARLRWMRTTCEMFVVGEPHGETRFCVHCKGRFPHPRAYNKDYVPSPPCPYCVLPTFCARRELHPFFAHIFVCVLVLHVPHRWHELLLRFRGSSSYNLKYSPIRSFCHQCKALSEFDASYGNGETVWTVGCAHVWCTGEAAPTMKRIRIE